MATFSDSGFERNSLSRDWDFTETEYELSTLPSDSRRSSAVESILSSRLSSSLSLRSDDSQASCDSSQAVTLVHRSNSLLSCNFSDVSVRTGSTAYQRLPLRPVPPIPPPGRPRRNTLTPERNLTPEEAVHPPVSAASTTPPSSSASHPRAGLSRSHSKLGRSISLKRPRLKRIVSSFNSVKLQPSSLPANPMSRTFSSEGVRHLLKSLPPAYPPPPPPDSNPEVASKPPPYSLTAPHRSRSLDLPSPPLAAPPLPISRRPTTITTTTTTSSRSHTTSFSECLLSRSEETPTSTNRSSSSLDLRRRGWVCISGISVLLSCVCCIFSVLVFLHKNPWQVCVLQKGQVFNESDLCVVECLDSTRLCQVNSTNSKPAVVSFHGFLLAHSGECEADNHTLKLDAPGVSYLASKLQRQEGVNSEDGMLLILHEGLYFVYSSISFEICNENRADLQQYIVKKDNDVETILSQTTRTCDKDCQHSRYSTYTGGVFYLKEKDQVYVNVSGGRIYDRSSFLGLVIIGH